MIIADLNNIRILYEDELEKAHDLFKMIFAEKVDVFVTDKDDHLVGVLSENDYENGKKQGKPVRDCINREPFKLIVSDDVDRIARQIFYSTKYDYIPVVDENNRLLFCHFRSEVNRIIEYGQDSAEALIMIQIKKLEKKYGNSCDIKIFTDISFSNDYLKSMIVTDEDIPKLDKENSLVVLAFYESSDYLKAMDIVRDNDIKYIGSGCGCFRARKNAMENSRGVTDYISLDEIARNVIREEYLRRGKYFCLPDMENICQIINSTKDINGDYVEIGVFRGDTARVALRYMQEKGINRKAFFLDTYEGFTYPEALNSKDIVWANSHTETSLQLVKERLSDFSNFNCVKCNIVADNIPDEIGEIAVCNIDVDMEEAVEAALYKVKDRIPKGGIIIAEDYGHMPELMGANYVVNKFISVNKQFIPLYFPSGQMIMIRK